MHEQRCFDENDENAAAIDLRKKYLHHRHGHDGGEPHHRAPGGSEPQPDRGHEIDDGKEHGRRLPGDRMRLKAAVGGRADAAHLRPVIEALDQRYRPP